MGRKLESHAAVFCCGAYCLWSHNAGEYVFDCHDDAKQAPENPVP